MAKPEPPVRKTPKKVAKKTAKPVQPKGAEASSRRGGERVTSRNAQSNANGRADARTNDGGTKAASNYKGKVAAKLRRAKRYPRAARREGLVGTVRVAFTIASNGSVSGIRITRSSGHQTLDQAAIEMVRRASPMPKFPRDLRKPSMQIQVPVQYDG
ncbi:energy transducer TonB [Rhodobacterales bacterium]|nr:energy transducer TonB [Rhodobacterales bacterium]